MKERFDPQDIRQSDMDKLAEAIEEYISTFFEVMIIPDNLKDKYEDQINEGRRLSEKLVKKLKKGDRSVFKDDDEWNFLD